MELNPMPCDHLEGWEGGTRGDSTPMADFCDTAETNTAW